MLSVEMLQTGILYSGILLLCIYRMVDKECPACLQKMAHVEMRHGCSIFSTVFYIIFKII